MASRSFANEDITNDQLPWLDLDVCVSPGYDIMSVQGAQFASTLNFWL